MEADTWNDMKAYIYFKNRIIRRSIREFSIDWIMAYSPIPIYLELMTMESVSINILGLLSKFYISK